MPKQNASPDAAAGLRRIERRLNALEKMIAGLHRSIMILTGTVETIAKRDRDDRRTFFESLPGGPYDDSIPF